MSNNNCDSCFDGAKFKNLDYQQVLKNAKQYAVEKKQDMAVYKEANQWQYISVEHAIANGIAFSAVVSQY